MQRGLNTPLHQDSCKNDFNEHSSGEQDRRVLKGLLVVSVTDAARRQQLLGMHSMDAQGQGCRLLYKTIKHEHHTLHS
jgi:hypothetical protein